MHIKCLELLAATLATKTIAKSETAISILLRIDNTTTVAYINNFGGTASKELVLLTQDLWMWFLEKNIHITAVHLPGIINTKDRLEAEPLDIPEDQQSLRSTRSGLVCFQTICPVPTLLQLAARSIYTSNLYLPSGLGKHEVLCKSPLELGGQSTDKSAGSSNSASTSRPCLEDITLVPNSNSHAHRSPSVDNSGTRDSGQRGSHAPTFSVSRMAHLRKKF